MPFPPLKGAQRPGFLSRAWEVLRADSDVPNLTNLAITPAPAGGGLHSLCSPGSAMAHLQPWSR